MKTFFTKLQFILTLILIVVPCFYIANNGDDVLLSEFCKALTLVASINLLRLTQNNYFTAKK